MTETPATRVAVLVFACIHESHGYGATRQATITTESRIDLLSVDPGPHGDPERIAVDAVNLAAELGSEPIVLRASGHPPERILEAAARESVSLVAVGSRGLTGVRALGSVSERVAHRAPCSVLVARPA